MRPINIAQKPPSQIINADEWASPLENPLDGIPDIDWLPATKVKTPEAKV